MTRIISVVSGKGGVGKTTITANIGAALASYYKKDVITVDCNITTSHLGLYLGMYYYPTSLNKVLTGESHIDDSLYDYSIAGMRIIPASLSIDDLKGIDIANLKPNIKKLFGKADIVLLDAAPGLGREAMAALRSSDEALFVMTPFVPSMMDVIKTYKIADSIGVKPLGIVLNMAKEGKHELVPSEIEKIVELPVVSVIPRDKNVLKSLAVKIPVVDLAPRSSASLEMMKLAGYVAGQEYVPEGKISRLFRFLKRGKPRHLGFELKSGKKDVTWEELEMKYI
jgi:septum site-determining protein MinD